MLIKVKVIFFPVVMLICLVSHFSAVAGIHVQVKDKGKKLEAAADNAFDPVKPRKIGVLGKRGQNECPPNSNLVNTIGECKKAAAGFKKGAKPYVEAKRNSQYPHGCFLNERGVGKDKMGVGKVSFNQHPRGVGKEGMRPICVKGPGFNSLENILDDIWGDLDLGDFEDEPVVAEWPGDSVVAQITDIPTCIAHNPAGPTKATFVGAGYSFVCGTKPYTSPQLYARCSNGVNGQCQGECKDYQHRESRGFGWFSSPTQNEVNSEGMTPGTCICRYTKHCS